MLPFLALLPLLSCVDAHAAFWHPSMYGFNVTNAPDGRDNRPVAPLKDLDFKTWWMHGHMDFPPNKGDVFQLPAGQTVTTELACTKDATSFFASGLGGDVRDGNMVCPNSPIAEYHTNGINRLGGCGLAIAYKNDVHAVKPEDFAVFSVNHRCVWDRFTNFDVPAKLPECSGGKCICSFFWIHREDSGGEEMYMNPFDCNVTNVTSSMPIPPPKVPRHCPVDKSNCTVGAKQPFYWLQKEGNNVFNDPFDPPLYNDDYGFKNGAQNDLWDSVQAPATSSPTASSMQAASTPSSSVLRVASVAEPISAPSANSITSALNVTNAPASLNDTTSSGPVSLTQHFSVDESPKRVIRSCRARLISGNPRKRRLVLRKRVVMSKNWWAF